ncbi:MAG: hypothetical protein NTY46_14660 [Candidatus Sumerlaeota bacterium]|nr:hypothetical protein [Candidatus Sumerlaeota bacterium]
MLLSDVVTTDRNVARAINLERDACDSEMIRRYHPTLLVRQILSRFVSALEGEKVNAWSVTGPYGTGKSAFAAFLLSLCSGPSSQQGKVATDVLCKADRQLGRRLLTQLEKRKKQPFLLVKSTSRYESINRTLVRGLWEAVACWKFPEGAHSDARRLLLQLEASAHGHELPPTSKVVEFFIEARRLTHRDAVVVVDEFGKNLEYMVHHADQGDIFALQMLAESTGTFLWVNLHQAFGEYASTLSALQRTEWNKVQGRFEDIAFVEPASRCLDQISASLSRKDISTEAHEAIERWARAQIAVIQPLNLPALAGITPERTIQLYPISLLAALLLGELSRRFAQNDRTLFTFLSSGEANALGGFVHSHELNSGKDAPSLKLHHLYDYFGEVTLLHHSHRAETQRWIEIQSLITAHVHGDELELQVLKTVGSLNLLSGIPGIRASSAVIQAGLCSSATKRRIEDTLKRLVERKVLLHRRYADEYRLWEGSDFDFDKVLLEERARYASHPLAEALEQVAPLPDIVAARHSYQTGTFRSFARKWTTLDEFRGFQADDVPVEMDGRIWHVLGHEQFPGDLAGMTGAGIPVIIAYAPYLDQVKELALDAAATWHVYETHPQLEHDGIARREVRFRAEAATSLLQQFVTELFTSGDDRVQWFAPGARPTIASKRDLSRHVSQMCDQVYGLCPTIRMEMINYGHLTSAAAKARRELAEAMVSREMFGGLGLQGFGPEVAVYRALFASHGLHVQNGDQFKFVAPDPVRHPNLCAVWEVFESEIATASQSDQTVSVKTLIERLKRPPFGLREGPIPLLLCHYLLVRSDEVAIYQEGAYRPYFGDAEVVLMMRRPELFSLRRYVSTSLQREVVNAYMLALDTDALRLSGNPRNPSLLKIVGPLLRFMSDLPEYSKFTRSVSLSAQKLRVAVLNSREPLQLLFRDIPEALSLEPPEDSGFTQWKAEFRRSLADAIHELDQACHGLTERIERALIECFGASSSGDAAVSTLRATLQNRMKRLLPYCADVNLKLVLASIVSDRETDQFWAAGVAGRLVKKPADTWRDNDFEPFRAAAADAAERLFALEALVVSGIVRRIGENGSCGGAVLSLIRGNGSAARWVVPDTSTAYSLLTSKYTGLLDMPNEDRAAVCAMLLDSLQELTVP